MSSPLQPFKTSPVSRAKAGMDYDEIKSHSSLLSNERIAILFYTLDLASIKLNTYYDPQMLNTTRAVLYQLYKNIRSLIRNNGQIRLQMGLDTKVQGVYTTDVAFDIIDKMIMYCTFNGYTYKRCYSIAQQLNYVELELRDILQYFKYFFRAEYKQKPDVMIATEKYKEMADHVTLEQLKEVIGKNNKIDFESIENSFGKKITELDQELKEESDIEEESNLIDYEEDESE